MRDNITSRLSRLIGAGAVSLAGRLGVSAPEDRLDAAMARADLVLAEAQSTLGRLLAEMHETRKRLDAARSEVAAATAAAEAHIRAGNEAEARRVIARAVDLETDIPSTAAALETLGAERASLEGAVLRLVERRRAMAEDLKIFRSAGLSASRAESFAAAENDFVEALAAVARAPEAADEARETAAALVRLREDERARRIEARLAAVRAEATP